MPYTPPTQLQGITDLTLVADIKPGLVQEIFESRSYAWRLRQVLTLLDAARRASREADLGPSPFRDSVAHLRSIHFFRFATVQPGPRLLLNVTFDGGWEPYMRIIWGPLSTLLDLIFCHCKDYPLAVATSYEDYIGWVRDHEVPSHFFYTDSGGTVADRAFLNQLEVQQRTGGARQGFDARAAQAALATKPPPPPTSPAVATAIRSLKGLYKLEPFFGKHPAASADGDVPRDDASVLLRFTQDFLPELREWVAQGLFDPGQRFDALRPQFELERQWLMQKHWTRPKKRERLDMRPQAVQAGILAPLAAQPGCYTRGALVLARVVDPARACAWLREAAREGKEGQALISDGRTTELKSGGVACTVAITYPGLQHLGLSQPHLDSLPGEFIQGMEARAGILGDVRINHPRQWRRPLTPWQAPSSSRFQTEATTAAAAAVPKPASAEPRMPLNLSLVDLVIQLRTCESQFGLDADCSGLYAPLAGWIEAKLQETQRSGLEVLAVEPTWSRPPAQPATRDLFGFVDGVSQPTLTPSAARLFWDDTVKTGELLLGWTNDRGDGLFETAADVKRWTDFGTFMVVRKIRQYADRLNATVERAAGTLVSAGIESSLPDARELVRAKLMGRQSDGTPLVAQRGTGYNDFDYRHDPDGVQCPFASHVRRANPRAAQPGGRPPRIVRRGMSYGPAPSGNGSGSGSGSDAEDRGVLFMAYNASIAEQFEVIQRWLTGGNSSGVCSTQTDPLLGVPQAGEPAVFRFLHADQVVRVELGDQPYCRLEWGLYAFVPSMEALREWPEPAPVSAESEVKPQGHPEAEQPMDKAEVKALFEDELQRGNQWEDVRRAQGGVRRLGPFAMVGRDAPILEILRDDGTVYSASGYAERMDHTLGWSPFGEDHHHPENSDMRELVEAIKETVEEAVTEASAFGTAYESVRQRIDVMWSTAQRVGQPGVGIDTVDLGTSLIEALFQQWFGVMYEGAGPGFAQRGGWTQEATPVRCPGHFLTVARRIFSPDPNATVQDLAERKHGPALATWIAAFLASDRPYQGDHVLARMLSRLQALEPLLERIATRKGIKPRQVRDGVIANIMLGLPATLLGSWAKVLRAWANDRTLWRLQHELLLPGAQAQGKHAAARRVLYKPLLLAMAADPVADGIWRQAKSSVDKVGLDKVRMGDVLWLGLGAALKGAREPEVIEDLLFGGSRDAKSDRRTPHACPGRHLALGALLGGLAALLGAGSLAATPSPTVLELTR